MYALIVLPFLSTLCDTFRGRALLQLELLALRHQLAVIERTSPRPILRPADRLLWVILSRILPTWRDVLDIVKPDTVIGWHRKGFRLSVANSYSRGVREFEKATAMLFPSKVAQRGRMRDLTAAPFRGRVTERSP